MGKISGEWIIYGVEWDNPENGSLYLQTIAGTDMILMLCSKMKKPRINIKRSWIFLWKKSILKRFVFYRQVFLFYSTSVVSGCNTTRFPEALRQITLG